MGRRAIEAAMPRPQLRSWTAPIVAAQRGSEEASRLVARSGLVHLGAVFVTASIAAALAAAPLPSLGGWALPAAGLLLGVLLLAGVFAAESNALVALLTLAVASAGGIVVALLSRGEATGAWLPFASGIVLAEFIALAAHRVGKPTIGLALGLMAAPLSASVLAYVPASFGFASDVTPRGLVIGAVIATVLTAMARYSEAALPWRHGADQIWQAALGRWTEPMRTTLLWLSGGHAAGPAPSLPPPSSSSRGELDA